MFPNEGVWSSVWYLHDGYRSIKSFPSKFAKRELANSRPTIVADSGNRKRYRFYCCPITNITTHRKTTKNLPSHQSHHRKRLYIFRRKTDARYFPAKARRAREEGRQRARFVDSGAHISRWETTVFSCRLSRINLWRHFYISIKCARRRVVSARPSRSLINRFVNPSRAFRRGREAPAVSCGTGTSAVTRKRLWLRCRRRFFRRILAR